MVTLVTQLSAKKRETWAGHPRAAIIFLDSHKQCHAQYQWQAGAEQESTHPGGTISSRSPGFTLVGFKACLSDFHTQKQLEVISSFKDIY